MVLSLKQQIIEALSHPVGDDSLVTDPVALEVLKTVKENVDFNLAKYNQKLHEGLDMDEWDDIQILDENLMYGIAKELVHNAFLAKQAEDFENCSTFATKALNAMSECEDICPGRLQALRNSLEKL